MSVQTIDAKMLQKMFLAGAKGLEAKKEYINELNVFPVPDGDTGTNMTMTIMAAAKDVANLQNPTLTELGKAISSGSLRGARGNSGVIMSQIFRGFVKELKRLDIIDVTALGNGVQHAAETAYKAVMKPKEGTILTVAKAGADKSMDLLVNGDTDDIIKFCDEVAAEMEGALLQTPELLPVLKQAGVVDSGGEGLMTFIRGALDALKGKATDFTVNTGTATRVVNGSVGASEEEDIRFGYCTEFIIMLERGEDVVESQLKEYLQKIGDCVVVVADDDIVKVHVHTNDPGLAIQKALTYGSLTSMKIDNMREEHQEKLIKDAEKLAQQQKEEEEEAKKQAEQEGPVEEKDMAFISVSIGEGINEIFRSLGVDEIIEGGQTMNPSTEDILEAIEKVHAKSIFILPNNKNIILAANQAATLVKEKHVIVIPTKTVPQGIAALINYIPENTPQENEAAMKAEIENVKSGQVTYAVRDTIINEKEIKRGDYMGIGDSGIISVGKDRDETLKEMLSKLVDEDSALISLYYGDEITEEEAEKVGAELGELYPDLDVEVNYGGQPVYYYVISVE